MSRPTPHDGDVLVELHARHGAAVHLLSDGLPDEAVPEFRALVDGCREVLGPLHPETLTAEGNLAVAYVMNEQVEEGARLMAANLASREEVFGDQHPCTLRARDALATTYRLIGRLPEALWIYSRVARQRNEVLGTTHPETLITRLGLALTLADAGDAESAAELVDAAWRDSDTHNGAGHRCTVLLRSHLDSLRVDAPVEVGGDPTRARAAPVVPVPRSGRAEAGSSGEDVRNHRIGHHRIGHR